MNDICYNNDEKGRKTGESMRCKVKITTAVDGKRTQIVRHGCLEHTSTESVLTYTEENARISVRLQNGTVSLLREGDYSLSIRLEKGKTLDGSLGLGGNVGKIHAQTDKIGYAVTENSLVLDLKYTLLAGEPQKMQVKIEAKGE